MAKAKGLEVPLGYLTLASRMLQHNVWLEIRRSSLPPPPRSSADETLVGEPHVKQVRTVPEAKLMTSGTIRFDTLPLECQKSSPRYQVARKKWAMQEKLRVLALGLKVPRTFVGESKLIIEWESAKPVMSDTLEPDPADGIAVMERAYLVNDAALETVRRVEKMAKAGLQVAPPRRTPSCSTSHSLQSVNRPTPGSATADLIHRLHVQAQQDLQAAHAGDLAVGALDNLFGVPEAVENAKVNMAGVVKAEVDDMVKVETDNGVKIEVEVKVEEVKVEVDEVMEMIKS
ncbi:hypothetical protein FA95DRAFT_1613605 [Auriscalpium vulgare]|uniref:Uncharacterized protein n=1 Tax=Auriscalpium vulgare TaxID=40419 RepID=A0ACB8R2W5_9AGAM|nr:hypothetical protein FA95DRAFT_1613605 [Auriscalpium vulgare]